MKTRIIFVRHAEAVGNFIREFHGWTDQGITERGRLQAQHVARALKDTPVDVIYSSILKRTIETAEYISKVKGIPIIPREDLKEINGGLWEGMPFAELPKKYPKEYATWETQPHLHQMPEGESMIGFQQRLITAVKEIINREKGKNICIVTHGTAIRVLLCWFKGWTPEQIIKIPWFDNTAITIITEDEGRFDIELEGDASHLDEQTSTFMNQRWFKEYKEKFDMEKQKEEIMKNMAERLTECLFKTKAIRTCPANEPFWYTSGKIGPYYINTHFLYGSEEKAAELLKVIDNVKDDREQCTEVVFGHVLKNYMEDPVYKTAIDTLAEKIRATVSDDSYQYVSGGERRDWFFSLIIAHLFDKPHITIFKDLDFVIWYKGKTYRKESLDGAKVIHVADLITSASSYERAWIPAIRNAAGKMEHSFVIIDRMQGGRELLSSFGVSSHSLVNIDVEIFREAYKKNYINSEQYNMVLRYIEDPDAFMERFFRENPDFIEKALQEGGKTAERARLCIESGFYPKI